MPNYKFISILVQLPETPKERVFETTIPQNLNLHRGLKPFIKALTQTAAQNTLDCLRGATSPAHHDTVCQALERSQSAHLHDFEAKLKQPEVLFAHSKSLRGLTRHGTHLEGSNSIFMLIARGQQLFLHAQRAPSSSLNRSCQRLADALIEAALWTLQIAFTKAVFTNVPEIFPPDTEKTVLGTLLKARFESAKASCQTPILIPISNDTHQIYFGVKISDANEIEVTYYELAGKKYPPDTPDAATLKGSKTKLQRLIFHPQSPEWAIFLRQATLLIAQASSSFDAFQTYLDTLPPSNQSLTNRTFNVQTVGNCAFKGLSAVIHEALGDGYKGFRKAEHDHYQNQLSRSQKRYYGREKFTVRTQFLIFAGLGVPCDILESQYHRRISPESAQRLVRLRHPKWKDRMAAYLTRYCKSLLDGSGQNYPTYLNLLGLQNLEKLTSKTINRHVREAQNAFIILKLAPIPLRILYTNPDEAIKYYECDD
ncbi:MAG: hypothetical protein AB7F28_03430 [Candidatus Margulisiibacteriota bacterium]